MERLVFLCRLLDMDVPADLQRCKVGNDLLVPLLRRRVLLLEAEVRKLQEGVEGGALADGSGRNSAVESVAELQLRIGTTEMWISSLAETGLATQLNGMLPFHSKRALQLEGGEAVTQPGARRLITIT